MMVVAKEALGISERLGGNCNMHEQHRKQRKSRSQLDY
jgi:hypothetical protein